MRFGFRYKPKDRLANAIIACNCNVKVSASCIGGDRVYVHRDNMGCQCWHCIGVVEMTDLPIVHCGIARSGRQPFAADRCLLPPRWPETAERPEEWSNL